MVEEKYKKRIGILRGGTGNDYDFSIEKGSEIISHIFENLSEKFKPIDILIDKKGDWHLNGFPINQGDILNKVDVVWDTSKDSTLSLSLNNFSIPSIGNDSFFNLLKNNNDMLRKHMKGVGVEMPRSIVLPAYQKDFDGDIEKYVLNKAKEVLNKFPAPWIVKSFTPHSNMGIHLVKTFPELVDTILDGVSHEKSILIEEFIMGKVASVHSVPFFRKQDVYIFPLGNSFGTFNENEKEKLFSLVKDLHSHLGVKHYLKSDFVLNNRGKIYLLSIDGSPDLKKDSHFNQVCESVGAKAHHIIEHIIENILN